MIHSIHLCAILLLFIILPTSNRVLFTRTTQFQPQQPHSQLWRAHLLDLTQATGKNLGGKPFANLHSAEDPRQGLGMLSTHFSRQTQWERRFSYLAGGTSILEETTFRFCSRRQMERVFSFSWSRTRLAFLVSTVFISSSMAKGNKWWWDVFLLESRFKSSAWNVKVISRLVLPTWERKHRHS